MPRGGKRPGAGAPRGNFNGFRTGKHSVRLDLLYVALKSITDYKALAHELHHAGFFLAPRYHFNNDYRGFVEYLYARLIDNAPGAQSIAINC
jgi:hypothetical protein